MTVKQVSVFVENKAGRLAEITGMLGAAGIDLRAMSIADTADFGILRIIVDDPEKASDLLKDADCIVSVTDVLAVAIADEPGSLARVLKIFADEELSIEYLYAFVSRKTDSAYVVFRMENNAKAEEVLAKNGIKLAAQSDIETL